MRRGPLRRLGAAGAAAVMLAALTGCVLTAWAEGGTPPASGEGLPPVDLRRVEHEGVLLDVVRVDLDRAKLGLYWQKPDGTRLGSLLNLKRWLDAQGERMLFATNAGIFRPGYIPGGLHIEDGRELTALNLRDGAGNFHLKPNGVFHIRAAGGAGVTRSEDYALPTEDVLLATQSGPMLVIGGQLHPAFLEDSTHLRIRSGVGVQTPTTVYFVLSRGPITFHHLARFFRDELGCADALYLDGDLSSFHVPGQRETLGLPLYAGMIAATAPAQDGAE